MVAIFRGYFRVSTVDCWNQAVEMGPLTAIIRDHRMIDGGRTLLAGLTAVFEVGFRDLAGG